MLNLLLIHKNIQIFYCLILITTTTNQTIQYTQLKKQIFACDRVQQKEPWGWCSTCPDTGEARRVEILQTQKKAISRFPLCLRAMKLVQKNQSTFFEKKNPAYLNISLLHIFNWNHNTWARMCFFPYLLLPSHASFYFLSSSSLPVLLTCGPLP